MEIGSSGFPTSDFAPDHMLVPCLRSALAGRSACPARTLPPRPGVHSLSEHGGSERLAACPLHIWTQRRGRYLCPEERRDCPALGAEHRPASDRTPPGSRGPSSFTEKPSQSRHAPWRMQILRGLRDHDRRASSRGHGSWCPGASGRGLIIGLNRSATGTRVERQTRFGIAKITGGSRRRPRYGIS